MPSELISTLVMVAFKPPVAAAVEVGVALALEVGEVGVLAGGVEVGGLVADVAGGVVGAVELAGDCVHPDNNRTATNATTKRTNEIPSKTSFFIESSFPFVIAV